MTVIIVISRALHFASHYHTDAHEETEGATRGQSNHRDYKKRPGLVGIVDAGEATKNTTYDSSHLKALKELRLSLPSCTENALHLSRKDAVGFLFFLLVLLELTVDRGKALHVLQCSVILERYLCICSLRSLFSERYGVGRILVFHDVVVVFPHYF